MSSTWEVKDEYRKIFLEESQDQLQEWEESILYLEKSPGDRETINSLFRVVHTLKGSAGFVGFQALQELTHELETKLQDVRDGVKSLSPSAIELLFEVLDICRKLINAFADNREYEGIVKSFREKMCELQDCLELLSEEKKIPETDTQIDMDAQPVEGEECAGAPAGTFYRIDVIIESDTKEAYLRALLIQSKLEEIGRVIEVQPALEELRLRDDDFRFQVLVESSGTAEELRRAVSIDMVKIFSIEETSEETRSETEETGGGREKSEINVRRSRKRNGIVKNEEVVRVPVDKLDVMLNLVGELVVQNSGFISTTEGLKELYGRSSAVIDLEEKTESLAKTARNLQDAVMKVRMLPVATVFNRFNRVVRDLARNRGKDVVLEIFGEETEIDKKVMDRIGDPLVHLVRNAVDHGIESTSERVAANKRATGLIRLGAYQEGDHICIDVFDDGRGLDRDKILSRALDKGLIRKEECSDLTDEVVYGFIFRPGFSTAEKVTDISGRGVGLDVVKRTVDDMGGSIRIKSLKGRETTITITLPLTMAIISAILVESSNSLYAFPLSLVREVIKEKRLTFGSIGQSTMINLRGEVISVVHLNEVLDLSSHYSFMEMKGYEEIPVVIVEYGGRKIGIGVERLLGKDEIVIKSLSRHYRELEGLVGASIMGDGRIALILDVEAMVRMYYRGDGNEGAYSNKDVSVVIKGDNNHTKAPNNLEIKEPRPFCGESDLGDKEVQSLKTVAMQEVESARDTEPVVFIDKRHRKVIEEIHNNGAISASISMTQLMEREIKVTFPETGIVQLGEVASLLGGEENPVGGVYIGITGDLTGGALIVLPEEHLFQVCDYMYRRKPGTTTELKEEDLSGITEMGNILSASFINAMGDTTDLTVHSEVPEVSHDMCLAVIDSVLARFNQPGENLLMTEAMIFCEDIGQALCHILIFLEPESMETMIEKFSEHAIEQVGG
jgi:chemotaxis protein histidine kinase CheA/chemotaxis protein CheY-P-specific phosphatase CheC